jgi:hypothetical protein
MKNPTRVRGPVPAQFAQPAKSKPAKRNDGKAQQPCRVCGDSGFVMAQVDDDRHQQLTARPRSLVSYGLFCPTEPPAMQSNFSSVLDRLVFGVEEVICPLCAQRQRTLERKLRKAQEAKGDTTCNATSSPTNP